MIVLSVYILVVDNGSVNKISQGDPDQMLSASSLLNCYGYESVDLMLFWRDNIEINMLLYTLIFHTTGIEHAISCS